MSLAEMHWVNSGPVVGSSGSLCVNSPRAKPRWVSGWNVLSKVGANDWFKWFFMLTQSKKDHSYTFCWSGTARTHVPSGVICVSVCAGALNMQHFDRQWCGWRLSRVGEWVNSNRVQHHFKSTCFSLEGVSVSPRSTIGPLSCNESLATDSCGIAQLSLKSWPVNILV